MTDDEQDGELHNSRDACDADDAQPEEQPGEFYAVDPGDFARSIKVQMRGRHSYEPFPMRAQLSHGCFSEEEVRKGTKMNRIEADCDVVKAAL